MKTRKGRNYLLIAGTIILILIIVTVLILFLYHPLSPNNPPTPEIATNTIPPLAFSSISGKVTTSDGKIALKDVGILAQGALSKNTIAAITADNGSYSLNNLSPDTYTLTVVLPDYESVTQSILLQSGQDLHNVNFNLRRESTISGKVTKADGTPLANISIVASGTGESDLGAAISAEDGTYKIEGLINPGTYQIEALADEFGFADQKATIPAEGDDINSVDFTAFAGEIDGKITQSDGVTPVSDAKIDLQVSTSEEAPPSSQRLTAAAQTGTDGTFSVESLQPINYTLQVYSPGYGIEIRDVHISEKANKAVVNISLKPAGSLAGQITQEDGKTPIGGVTINILDQADHLVALPSVVMTDQSGNYAIDNLAEGQYTLMAKVSDSTSLLKPNVTVKGGQKTENIDLQFIKTGGAVTGCVFQADGVTPIQQAFVVIVSETAGGSAYTSADGSFTISDLPAGNYSLVVSATGFRPQTKTDIALVIGKTIQLNLSLPTK